MRFEFNGAVASLLSAAMIATVGIGVAEANTVTQNTSWTIDRAGTSANFRVVAYGDSIYAGYNGAISNVGIRAAPWAEGEYLSALWNADIEVMRRTKSGAIASDIYNNKIVSERSYMQTSNTRVVTMEMCGNDGLQARTSFSGQSGTCNYGVLDTALNNCTNYQQLAMQYINANAHQNATLKIVANLYYPGYDADNVLANCTDATSGQRPNRQDIFLPYIARMNWRACDFANTYGWECADSFAEMMGADYDSNGDTIVDSAALAYVQGESETDYVTRMTQTLRSTLRDANAHLVNASTSYDYIQSDDVHPTYSGGTVGVGLFGGTGSGTSAPTYPTNTGGKNPIWDQYGHERMGWSLSTFSDPIVTTTSSTTTTSTTTTSTTTTTLPPTCIADGGGQPCGSSTNCCSGTGNCTGGKPPKRVCAAPAAPAAICGDGVVEGSEECEAGVSLADSCVSLGFASGTLACGTGCQYDTSGCSGGGTCGAAKDFCSADADCCSNNCNTRKNKCR
ncbi:MAG: lysophospholipase L1-like esterase [Hyphomicrobiaceae bacterium]